MRDLSPKAAGPSPRAVPARVQIIIVAAAGLALVLIWGAIALVGSMTAPKITAQPEPTPGAFRPTEAQWANLSFAPVLQRDFAQKIDTDGKVATDDERTTPVFSPVSGRVTRVIASAGARVVAGQPLFAVRAAEFIQAQADLVAAEAGLRVASAAKTRQEALFKVEGAAQKDVQQSVADLENAKASLEAVRNRLRILGVSDAAIQSLEQKPAGVMAGEILVTAPISGVVIQRTVGAGQNVASLLANGGGAPAFTVSDLSKVWLVANVREEDAGALRLGAPISAVVPAYPGVHFSGGVNYIAPSVDPASRRIVVRAEIQNTGGRLRPEMFAALEVTTGPASRALAVPENAVIYEVQEARVWVVAGSRRLALRKIAVGRTAGGFVEVLSGLKAGDQVVAAGAIFIDRAAANG